ncbi:MAG: hypothetical protein OEL89_00540 [Candidatus Peregrinibacteria bacterium]|nr:hypothetical protein [Candidatus Peregrinibacteria bacterium]
MEYLKNFVETKLTVEKRVQLIKQLMDVDPVYEDIQDYILDNLDDKIKKEVTRKDDSRM